MLVRIKAATINPSDKGYIGGMLSVVVLGGCDVVVFAVVLCVVREAC